MQTFLNSSRRRSSASPYRTRYRYSLTKIKFFTDPLWTKYIKTMLRRQAYRFELRPSGQQLRSLRQFAGSCRFVYNLALALNTARYNKKRLGYAGRCAQLLNWKRERQFLSEVPARALQQALKNPERAYTNFFLKRLEFPKFKKKGQRESVRIPQGRQRYRTGLESASLVDPVERRIPRAVPAAQEVLA